MNAIANAVASALLHFLWQGALIALLFWVALRFLRNASPQVRYMAGCAALAIMAALPVVTACLVYRSPVAAGAPPVGFVEAAPSSAPFPGPGLFAWLAAIQGWVLPVWIAGVAAFAVRLIWASKQVARLRREGSPADAAITGTVARLSCRMKVGRPVRVLISSLADCPTVVGWLKPVVLLPAATLMGLSVEQLEAVLAHELAHIRRHDYLVNLLQVLIETLFFYQPAVWWISSRMRAEREFCCDDLAVGICRDPIVYARALTKLERLRTISPELAMSSTAPPLLSRIRRLTGQVPEQPASNVPAVLALGLVLVCLLTNVRWAHAQPQSDREGSVRKDAIWTDTVRRGELPIMVRALGTISAATTVELNVVASQAIEVRSGQRASIELRPGLIAAGKVTRVDSSVVNGTVAVTIDVQSPVPEFVGKTVDGTIRIKTLEDVIYVGRPVRSETTLFKLEPDGNHARQVKVRFGAPSVNTIQVLEGLQPGDRVILSDMAPYSNYDRVRLE
jgi:beta-lactamase regulating signal transducer with metallopeptidase domain